MPILTGFDTSLFLSVSFIRHMLLTLCTYLSVYHVTYRYIITVSALLTSLIRFVLGKIVDVLI